MSYKKDKLQAQMLRLISELIVKDIKDPRVGFVTITGVEVNSDYTRAMVGVSIMGSEDEIRKSFDGITSSAGFIQHRLNKSLSMRFVPRIDFFLDSSVENGVRMVDIIDSLDGKEKSAPDEEDPNQDRS
jgi:ribosome-binding factor A